MKPTLKIYKYIKSYSYNLQQTPILYTAVGAWVALVTVHNHVMQVPVYHSLGRTEMFPVGFQCRIISCHSVCLDILKTDVGQSPVIVSVWIYPENRCRTISCHSVCLDILKPDDNIITPLHFSAQGIHVFQLLNLAC